MLEEEIRELEALEEVHEQLVESNHELEMDLREELDMAQAARRDVSANTSLCFSIIHLHLNISHRCNVKRMQPSKQFWTGTKRY